MPKPTNREAAEATLASLHSEERLIELDAARETAFLAIATRLDAFPGNALLWGQYLELEAELRRTDDGGSDFAKLVEALRTPLVDGQDPVAKDNRH